MQKKDSFILALKIGLKQFILKGIFHVSGVLGLVYGLIYNYIWKKTIMQLISYLDQLAVRKEEEDKVLNQMKDIKKSSKEVEFDKAADKLD